MCSHPDEILAVYRLPAQQWQEASMQISKHADVAFNAGHYDTEGPDKGQWPKENGIHLLIYYYYIIIT
jgi:hypothetical protein